jgi:hypothetical protein
VLTARTPDHPSFSPFLIAPPLNGIIFHFGHMPKRKPAVYLLNSIMLYGSMFFVSLRSSITSVFGKSVFLVTPKHTGHVSVKEASAPPAARSDSASCRPRSAGS